MIDLRSDTCSRPTPAMRTAMANAEVGDDVYGDDPTVRALERATAALLGKEAAVYMPTGTMTNQVAIRAHTEAGDAVLFDQSAHVYILEGGAPAAFAGVLPRLLPGVRGIFQPHDLDQAIGQAHHFFPATIQSPVRLLCVENTHNIGGGAVWPMATLTAVAARGRAHGLLLHLDGARLWHATAATGISEAEYAAPFDSVSVCFSKALGAPVGSCLAGSAEFIARARRFKQQIGGGFRQAGIIAAGALHALEHHRPQLIKTHQLAARFAAGIALIGGIELDASTVETNIVRFGLARHGAAGFVEEAYARGLYLLPSGAGAVRAVFYLDITEAEVDAALRIVRDTLAHLSANDGGAVAAARPAAASHAGGGY